MTAPHATPCCCAAVKREPPVQPAQAMAMASNLLHNLSFKPPKRVISLAEQPPLEEQIAGGCRAAACRWRRHVDCKQLWL